MKMTQNIFENDTVYYINRLNDVYFKYLLGTENRKDLTLNFINSILKRTEDNRFIDIEFTNTNLTAEMENEKVPIVDILAKTNTGDFINIEVQVAKQSFFTKRTLYYWARLYGRQLNSGRHYRKLKKTIMINLVNFNCIDNEFYHNSYHVKNDKTNENLLDDLELHFIELKKFKFGDIRKLRQDENWIAYFSPNCTEEERKLIAMNNSVIQKALNAEMIFAKDEEQFAQYEHSEKVLRDYYASIEDNRQEAKQEGIQIGMQQGIQQANIQNAINFLKLGIDIEKVAEGTNLSIEKVKELQQSI